MSNLPTIRTVALLAGVSIKTVSRVINGETQHVTPALAGKVRAAVEELGYVPNPLARSLRTEGTVTEVDPTELVPGDVVLGLSDHDLAGCHCDVRVKVLRYQRAA